MVERLLLLHSTKTSRVWLSFAPGVVRSDAASHPLSRYLSEWIGKSPVSIELDGGISGRAQQNSTCYRQVVNCNKACLRRA